MSWAWRNVVANVSLPSVIATTLASRFTIVSTYSAVFFQLVGSVSRFRLSVVSTYLLALYHSFQAKEFSLGLAFISFLVSRRSIAVVSVVLDDSPLLSFFQSSTSSDNFSSSFSRRPTIFGSARRTPQRILWRVRVQPP